MLNRNQIAHEYILSGVATTVHSAFQLADAMIAEAEKRTDKKRPAILSDWISVEDRLPKAQTLVITYNEDGEFETDYAPFLGRITHWQPMPNPPKEVK